MEQQTQTAADQPTTEAEVPHPTEGGSYVRDPETHALTRVGGTAPPDTAEADPATPNA